MYCNSVASGCSSSTCRSSSSLEALVESRQGVHSRSSRRRGQLWQQPLVVEVVSRQGVAVVVESRQGVAVLAVVADVAVVSGVSGSSCSRSSGSRRRQACQGVAVVSAALVFDW